MSMFFFLGILRVTLILFYFIRLFICVLMSTLLLQGVGSRTACDFVLGKGKDRDIPFKLFYQ